MNDSEQQRKQKQAIRDLVRTEEDYSVEYGKTLERIRILDLIAESNLEPFIKIDLHDLIMGENK